MAELARITSVVCSMTLLNATLTTTNVCAYSQGTEDAEVCDFFLRMDVSPAAFSALSLPRTR